MKSLRKKAARLPELEAAVAASSYEELSKAQSEAAQLASRVALLEGQLASMAEERGGLRRDLKSLRAEGQAASWLASEELNDAQHRLQAQAERVKAGLALRVVLQCGRSRAARCWKAWQLYVMRRQLMRKGGAAADTYRSVSSGLASVGAGRSTYSPRTRTCWPEPTIAKRSTGAMLPL